ncbi:MAG: preprotein translocase subunit SecG [Dehalococcoidales bacterium]|nr:preprotein translocase subunit SecG [Dehalococcoidales bacterium]
METALKITQMVLSVLLVVVILLQVKGGSGLGGIFGGSESVYRTKRGVEKWLFWATIILSVLFVLASIANVAIG